jgi:hypothetical protein
LPARDRRDPHVDHGWTTFVNLWFMFVGHRSIVAGAALRLHP